MSKTRIPTPLYAVAGAGDLAYQRLRHLPETVTELREKAAVTTAELRQRATAADLRAKALDTLRAANATAASLRQRAGELDAEQLRAAAVRNVATLVAGVHAAQERARAVYARLVAHGERVLSGQTSAPPSASPTPAQPAAPAALDAPTTSAPNDSGPADGDAPATS